MPETFERIMTTGEKAALRGEVFASCELVGVDLSGADLREACFERARLIRCDLSGADLRGARFTLCNLRGLVVENAVFGENRFDGTILEEVVGLSSNTQELVVRGGGTFQPLRASSR
jgi:uncharacterized protein YjbI with pentapeptide repeats